MKRFIFTIYCSIRAAFYFGLVGWRSTYAYGQRSGPAVGCFCFHDCTWTLDMCRATPDSAAAQQEISRCFEAMRAAMPNSPSE